MPAAQGGESGKGDSPGIDARHGKGIQFGPGNLQVNFHGIADTGSSVPLGIAEDPLLGHRRVDTHGFTGREWLLGEIDQVVEASRWSYVFVEADAGMGKTAFAAWLAGRRRYSSHFFPAGGSVPAALANLSAQLIRAYGLVDLAPGGMLPGWAHQPEGFGRLLAYASQAALARQERVVLVIDALDQADLPDHGPRCWLPGVLPDGVHVIGTYRTGWGRGMPAAPKVILRITGHDQRNRQDVLAYLAKTAGEGAIAAVLSRSGTGARQFADTLAERSGGVWIYLHAVLAELRLGRRQVEEIENLPHSLYDYYAEQVRRWREGPDWAAGLQRLLATLAVAREPLTAAALARLAGNADPLAVQRWCDLTVRPFLSATFARSANPQLQYEIYHASFREVLNPGAAGPPAPGKGELAYDLVAMTDGLRQAATAAHSRIADTYLACFGGLDDGLALLAANPGLAELDAGYPLRHLSRHLRDAGRDGDLHALLAAEHHQAGGRLANTWFTAHDHAGIVAGYLEDLALARAASAAATDEAARRRRPAPALGLEVRYALMAASVATGSAKVSVGLLRQLVCSGAWPARKGLDHARRIPDPFGRVEGLLVVHGEIDEGEQPVVVAEALAAVPSISADYLRAVALAHLGPRLPPHANAEALAHARAITDHGLRAWALAALAARAPASTRREVLAEALAETRAITRDLDGAWAMIRVVPYLAGQDRRAVLADAVTACSAASGDVFRVLKDLVPLVTADDDHVIAEVMTLTTRGPARLFVALAPLLPPRLIPDALAAARTFAIGDQRAEALASLVPRLTGGERRDVIAEALACARAPGHSAEFGQAHGLAAVLPHLTGDERQAVQAEALAAVRARADGWWHSESIGLALRLAPDQRGAVVTEVLAALRKDQERVGRRNWLRMGGVFWLLSLISLLPYVAGEQRRVVLADALDMAMADFLDPRHSDHLLVELAEHLAGEERRAALVKAMASLTLGDDFARARLLAALFPHVSAEQRTAALTAVRDALGTLDADRARVLERLLPHLTGEERRTVLAGALADLGPATVISFLGQFLTAQEKQAMLAAARESRLFLADYLPASLMPYMTGEERRAWLAGALTSPPVTREGERQLTERLRELLAADGAPAMTQALDVVAAISGEYDRARALAVLAPLLPAGEETVMLRALEVAGGISSAGARQQALSGLAPHLLRVLAGRTPAVVRSVGEEDRATVLCALMPHLTGDVHTTPAAELLADARALNDADRAVALAAFAPCLAGEERRAMLAEAITAVRKASDERCREYVLAKLAPLLSAEDEPIAVLALEVATGIAADYIRGDALKALAAHLPPVLAGQGLAAVKAISNEQSRGFALAKLAPALPGDEVVMAQAVETATAMRDEYARSAALRDLVPFLSPSQLAVVLAEAETISGAYSRADVLMSLVPRLDDEQRGAVLTQALAAARASDCTFGLAQLARQLNDDDRRTVIASALATARQIEDSESMYPADLKELIPLIPPELQAEALDAIKYMPHYDDRADFLAEFIRHSPVEMLVPALNAARRFGPRMMCAVIERGRQLQVQGGCIDLLRAGMEGVSREVLFQVIEYAAPDISEIAGSGGVQECFDAVTKACGWWP
jgi:hypothetical protein